MKASVFRRIPWKPLKLGFRSGGHGTLTSQVSQLSAEIGSTPQEGNTGVQVRAILWEMGYLLVIVS